MRYRDFYYLPISVKKSTFADARRGSRELDVTDAEAERLGGRQVARRGRKPKSAA